MTTETARHERWVHLGVRTWTIIGMIILAVATGIVAGKLSAALIPFGLALVIVVLLRGPVAFLVSHRVPRGVAIALCYLLAFAIVAVALLFIVPVFATQIGAFAKALPGYLDQAYKLWSDVTQPKGKSGVPGWVTTAILNLKDATVSSLGSISSQGLSIAYAAGSGLVTLVIDIVVALIVAFYSLLDLDKMRDEAMRIVPERFREEAEHVMATVTRVLGGWMRGALIDALVVGSLITLFLTIIGVPYGAAIGIIGGTLNIVPYLGPVFAAVLAAVSGLFGGSVWLAIWAVVIVLGVQQFDGLWLSPRIMSRNVDLHPVLVIFSLLTGATLFGVPGMLLAVPVAAIGKGIFVYYFERRTQESLCTEDGVLFRSPKTAEPATGAPEERPDPDRE